MRIDGGLRIDDLYDMILIKWQQITSCGTKGADGDGLVADRAERRETRQRLQKDRS